MNRRRLVKRAAALALIVASTLAIAAGKPLAISLSPPAQTVTEGQSAVLTLSKTGGGKPSMVKWSTSDGSASGSLVGAGTITVPTRDDLVVNGTRTVIVTAIATTGARATASIAVTDNDVAPPPPPPVQCPDGTTVPAGQTCPVAPPPPPPTRRPTYGDLVTGVAACQSITNKTDFVAIGVTYRVTGLTVTVPEGGSATLGMAADGVILEDVPRRTDGIHVGDGWWAIWVPMDCVAVAG
jgi:hypothetical protein